MGLFGSKKSGDPTERAMRQAEDIAAGKGLGGRLMKGFMGADNAARLGAAMDATRQAQAGAAAGGAGGAELVRAAVIGVADTGQLVNFDPVVQITVDLPGGQRAAIRTLVSKVQIPRQGDVVLVAPDPQRPGEYLYAGPAGL
ncbi:hypothetical protein AXK56_13165 [Tsukamurella pulmonis]|uniref:Uncharacterized protein n=1 Tax=Tsukamurella pulmonis TaxID=47312 RepID=A0A1H1GRJ4_9ACTN|nr:hypothetical protein [Tsukamurella pulmonis]KXO88297.1 hypothetical protein AXK56_13165 [Tsukamurella pulmonis]SDR15790.1 hypothetical protein SAMN04489765_3517 [Tsukamurella pulmonis]SUP16787.1 Uncharacterised protein [Tsukamurella pulmonis]